MKWGPLLPPHRTLAHKRGRPHARLHSFLRCKNKNTWVSIWNAGRSINAQKASNENGRDSNNIAKVKHNWKLWITKIMTFHSKHCQTTHQMSSKCVLHNAPNPTNVALDPSSKRQKRQIYKTLECTIQAPKIMSQERCFGILRCSWVGV